MNPDLMRGSPVCRTAPPEGYQWELPPFNVVFQFCAKDYGQALKVLQWSHDLAKQPNTIHLVTDEGFRCNTAIQIAHKSWGNVVLHHVKPCASPWPACNNHVFAETCRIMQGTGKPWLLWETDMIPARQDWLQALENEYSRACRPFMGAWVEAYDILNGGAVYPSDVISWSPSFFGASPIHQTAFDCAMAPDVIWFTHPVNHMMANVFFTRPNGRPTLMAPIVPVWNRELFDWVVTHNTCLIHRDKKGKTIEFLREKFGIRE
jgi:hypothetical protein